ncbi:MAG TPA: WbuC family cupin fold metalloprotein [Burkholderiales bacterium]|nr:WbuC family cupin fold metalloprotein [Burkholderiales bacterium]
MKPVELIDAQLIESVSAQAAASPRRRKNFNFHERESAPANRLLNAMEPDSYVQPHRHVDPEKDETLFVLRGAMGLVIFDDSGKILRQAVLRAGGDNLGVNLPHGTWHTFVSLEPGSVIFEAKAGPYHPLGPAEKAPWAPAEGDPAAVTYLAGLAELFRVELSD